MAAAAQSGNGGGLESPRSRELGSVVTDGAQGYDGPPPGEVSEWSKERDWKSRTCRKVRRGFKSRPLRLQRERPGAGRVVLLESAHDGARSASALPPSSARDAGGGLYGGAGSRSVGRRVAHERNRRRFPGDDLERRSGDHQRPLAVPALCRRRNESRGPTRRLPAADLRGDSPDRVPAPPRRFVALARP